MRIALLLDHTGSIQPPGPVPARVVPYLKANNEA